MFGKAVRIRHCPATVCGQFRTRVNVTGTDEFWEGLALRSGRP